MGGLDDIDEARRLQRQEALEKGRAVRTRQRILREALRDGELDWKAVLVGDVEPAVEAVAGDMRLLSFLPMVPGVGKSRATEILSAAAMPGGVRLGRLTPERRRELAYIVAGARGEAWSDPRYRYEDSGIGRLDREGKIKP